MSIRVGILGKRGAGLVAGIRSVSGVEVVAIAEANEASRKAMLQELSVAKAFDGLEPMLDSVDAVVVATPMHLHATHAMTAMAAGKHVLSEVTAAVSMEECWRLRDAVLDSGCTYMLAENYCYSEECVLVEELARRGLFGRPNFGEGEYVHEVRFLLRQPDGSPTWRAVWQAGLRGNTYITHELGPVMRWFKAVEPGVRIESVACMGTGPFADPSFPADDTSLTLVRLSNGGIIKVRLDLMSNRPGMTFYSLQGTHGVYEGARGGGIEARVWLGKNETVVWDNPPRLWKPLYDFQDCLPQEFAVAREEALKTGHSGGDYHCGRRFAEALLHGTPPDVGVFDALEWTAAGLASQRSASEGGSVVPIPNFRDPSQRPLPLDSNYRSFATPTLPEVRASAHRPPQVRMRRSNLEGLPPANPPLGYSVREFRPGDEEGIAATLTAAFGVEWTAEKVKQELTECDYVRKVFVVAHDTDGVVATASAAWNPAYPDEGYVHWVGTRPEHGGKRLGALATVAVMHDFVRQGLTHAMLETDDNRLGAIRVYLELGFVPDRFHASHYPRWEAIQARLTPFRKRAARPS